MIRIFESGDAALLEPLTCRRAPLEIQVAGTTLKGALERRWNEFFELAPLLAEKRLSAAADFWPSHGLIEILARGNGNFTLKADGRPVAWLSEGDEADANAVTVTPDEKSFRIVYPWHILAVNEDLLGAIRKSRIAGTVRERVTIDGVLVLGEGSVVLPGVYMEGVVVIGRNCKIGPNCYIRGTTFIGDKCHVGQAVEIKNSILMDHVAAGHLSYIGDSIVCPKTNFGAGTIISNFRHDGCNHRSMVNGELVDTHRRKFGAVIGDNVHTGIHSAIYPGRKIWPDAAMRPGTVVQKDLKQNDHEGK